MADLHNDWSDTTWQVREGIEALGLVELRAGAVHQALMIERLRRELQQLRTAAHRLRDDAEVAHAAGCWAWGPAHYLCALREIDRLKRS